MTKARSDLLRKVQGLIDKADSADRLGNDHEADAFRSKADQLMIDYAVESYELAAAAAAQGVGVREEPEAREVSFANLPDDVYVPMSSLYGDLVRHCRCMHVDYASGNRRVVGYAGDLDYLEMLWTSLRLDLSHKLAPQPVPGDFGASIAALKAAGRDWQQIFKALRDVFPHEFPMGHATCDEHGERWSSRSEYNRNLKGSPADCAACQANGWHRYGLVYRGTVKLSKAYAAHCKRTGVPQVKDAPQVWARSFTEGYVEMVRHRLHEIAEGRDVSTGAGLVLAGRDEALKEALYAMRPGARPHPDDCDCEDRCHRPKCRERATCTRTACVEARKPVRRGRTRWVVMSPGAKAAGREAGKTADLSGRNGRVGAGVKGAIG